jgi:pyridoxal phosphate enzyme (YggS family)
MANRPLSIEQNLRRVQERIAEAALRAGRDPSLVTLIAVTKTFPPEVILEGYAAGLRHFGENRPEEGAEKIPIVNTAVPGLRPTWHMVGHIQSRKADLVVGWYDVVHSVDRLKVAQRLSRFAVEAGRELPVLLECNISGEATKFGFLVDRWEEDAAQREAFFADCAAVLALPGLRVEGLMTVAPLTDDPETVRPVFGRLRALRDTLRERFPRLAWRELSMGMTDDFEVAVEEGATMVRIGRAIFGPRKEEL